MMKNEFQIMLTSNNSGNSIIFFDSNSWLVHRELNKKVYKLENQKDFYTEGIKKEKHSFFQIVIF